MSSFFVKHRSLVLLLGGLVLLAVGFHLAEILVGPPEPRGNPGSPESDGPAPEPIEIRVLRPDDHELTIEIDGNRHTQFQVGPENEANLDRFEACMRNGIEQARADGSIDVDPGTGLFARQAARHRVGEQVTLIQQRCFGGSLLGGRRISVPTPPPPPAPTGRPGS